jgi:hypothetical protein
MNNSVKHERLKRIVALTLAVSILNSALFPSISLALSAGPGAPEFASFEPVDATDMVNLLTGDFTYNIPVLNVPGPGGGYSLSMFYHAGITPEQESSWLGLGWNLNPGSLNRNIKGLPDDWKGKGTTVTSYNSPNTAYDYAVSVGFGMKGIWNANVSLNGGSYKSLGGSIGMGVGLENGVTAGANLGTDGTVSVGAGYKSLGVGVASYSDGNSAGQVSMSGGHSSIGMSFSSKGSSAFASVQNNTVGLSTNAVSQSDIMMTVQGGSASFQIYAVNVGVSFNYYTYWLWAMEDKYNYGTLYTADSQVANSEGEQPANRVADSYDNPYNADTYANAQAQALSNALTFPNYDDYMVSGQGIGGSISPRINQFGALTREGNIYSKFANGNTADQLIYWNSKYYFSKTNDQIYFQFDYEPGGYSAINPGTFTVQDPSQPVWGHTYDGGQLNTTKNGSSFYNPTTQRAGKGKYIEYFTNAQITSNLSNAIARGFIETESQKDQRGNPNLYDTDGIGAFSITTEDGKTYHYSLPVYHFEELQVFEQKNNPTQQYLENRKLEKYAYDWLLTSITGPDYVDRGTVADGKLGVIDEGDYGYWVKFDYGKWTDGYVWRAPYRDDSYTNASKATPYGAYSMGRKQLYYLNDIKTKTHTAYFIKSLKEDGRGKNINYRPDDEYHYKWEYKKTNLVINNQLCSDILANGIYLQAKTSETELFDSKEPNYILKLDKIILLNNADASTFETAFSGNNNSSANRLKEKISSGNVSITRRTLMKDLQGRDVTYCTSILDRPFTSYYEEKVLDHKDIQTNLAAIEQKALKIIEFNQNYSLCGGTPNSSAAASMGNGSVNGGKLTLNSVKIYGTGKADLLPGYYFNYNNQYSNPINYNESAIDTWGYYSTINDGIDKKIHADAWSLNEIITPLGGKIKIDYESDTYATEAALGKLSKIVSAISSITTKTATSITLKLPGNAGDLTTIGAMKINSNCDFTFKYEKVIAGGHETTYVQKTTPAKILSCDISNNTVTIAASIVEKITSPLTLTMQSDFVNGGGIRVKNILLDDGAGNQYKTHYNYNASGFDSFDISTGVTSFAPTTEQKYIPYLYELPSPGVMYGKVTVEDYGITNKSYLKTTYTFDVLSNATSNGGDFNMGNHLIVKDVQPANKIADYGGSNINKNAHHIYARSSVVTDNKSAIGRILGIAKTNEFGVVLSAQSFSYQNAQDISNGTNQETFIENKRYLRYDDEKHGSTKSDWYLTSSSRIMYPNVLKSIITQSNGIKSTTTNTKYDFCTGVPTEIVTENSNGEKYLAKAELAYSKYTTMGSKVADIHNKNMMSQGAGNYLYSLDGNNNPNLISASVQTWKENPWAYSEYNTGTNTFADVTTGPAVWRKFQTYVWKSDLNVNGTIMNTPGDFWTTGPTEGWQKTNEITRYDHYSNPLESFDINGLYVSLKVGGKNDEFIVATSGASNYKSFMHSSFEDLRNVAPAGYPSANYFGGEVFINGGQQVPTVGSGANAIKPHTGNYMIKIIPGEYGPLYKVNTTEGLQTGKTYRASVWVHKSSSVSTTLVAELDGNVNSYQSMDILNSKAIHVGDWILLSINIIVPKNYVSNGGSQNLNDLRTYVHNAGSNGDAYVDDMRLQPSNSPVTGYVYDQNRGLVTAVLDNENFATYFIYDAVGRLVKTEKETAAGVKKASETVYHYGRQ